MAGILVELACFNVHANFASTLNHKPLSTPWLYCCFAEAVGATEMRAAREHTLDNRTAQAPALRQAATCERPRQPAKHKRSGVRIVLVVFAGLVAITSYPPAKASPPHVVLEQRQLVRATTPEHMQTPPVDVTLAAGEDALPCYKVRKRLWDGESWIIRRVSICR